MLYLSLLTLNGRSPEARRDLADCHALHQRVLHAFPDDPDITAARERYGVLYRAEPHDNGARVLVQSRHLPDWSRLPAGYLQSPVMGPKRVDEQYAHVVAGQELVFRLRANPQKRISNRSTIAPERWRGKRVELRREEEQIAWLRHKGETNGFALLNARISPNGDVADVRAFSPSSRVTGKHGAHALTFGSVVFEGRLRITDLALFQRALEQGIGSGKAFGFGLLSVASASSAH